VTMCVWDGPLFQLAPTQSLFYGTGIFSSHALSGQNFPLES
jgi:hypothetical protein